MDNKKYLAQLLDRLVDLDAKTSKAFYEMGQILYTLWIGKAYKLLGYESLAHMIEEELSFGVSTGHRYLHTYRHFQRLHYTKAEALKLIKEHGWSNVCDILPNEHTKIGSRAMTNRIKELDEVQLNFTLTTKEYDEAADALIIMGASETDTGRLQHSSEAFMGMVRGTNKFSSKVA